MQKWLWNANWVERQTFPTQDFRKLGLRFQYFSWGFYWLWRLKSIYYLHCDCLLHLLAVPWPKGAQGHATHQIDATARLLIFQNKHPCTCHSIYIWLVVSTFQPLWKIWKSIGMMKFPIHVYIYIYMIYIPNHQPDILIFLHSLVEPKQQILQPIHQAKRQVKKNGSCWRPKNRTPQLGVFSLCNGCHKNMVN